jgi:hypothetical protein
VLNIYKTDDWTAEILTDEGGMVLDCRVIPRPMSEFERRMRERQQPHADPPRAMTYEGGDQ